MPDSADPPNISNARAPGASVPPRDDPPVWKNVGWVSFAAVFNRLIGLLTLGYGARALGPENFGIVGWASAIVAYVAILISPGLNTWGTREVARHPESAGETLLLVNGTLASLAILGMAGVAGFAFLGEFSTQERMVLLITGLALFNYALASEWVVRGLELMRFTAAFQTVSITLYVAGLFLFVHSPDDILLYPLIRVVTDAVAIAFGYGVIATRGHLRFAAPELRPIDILRPALPLMATAALVTVTQHANTLIAKAYVDPTSLGIYLAGVSLFFQIKNSRAAVGNVFFPYLTRLHHRGRAETNQHARNFAAFHVLLALAAGTFVYLEANSIVGLIYGVEYTRTVAVIQILAVAVAANFIVVGYTNPLLSFGRDRVFLLALVASSTVAVGGALLLVPRFGIVGAAAVLSSVDLAAWTIARPTFNREIGPLSPAVWAIGFLGALLVLALYLMARTVGLPFLLRLPVYLSFGAPVIWFSAKRLFLATARPETVELNR